jgi:hypothetical protein
LKVAEFPPSECASECTSKISEVNQIVYVNSDLSLIQTPIQLILNCTNEKLVCSAKIFGCTSNSRRERWKSSLVITSTNKVNLSFSLLLCNVEYFFLLPAPLF